MSDRGRACLPLPGNVSLADATIIETLRRCAMRRNDAHSKRRVGRVSAAARPAFHVRLAVLSGRRSVMVISRSKWKLDTARRAGAHHALQKDAEAAVEDVPADQGSGVTVIDTAGMADTLRIGTTC
jgi:D-arabinose 1-dehydrogenase-like Zn-dependent alcohol dehydrogenase